MTIAEELIGYVELAQREISATNGNGLADSLLEVSAAVARVGVILVDAEEGLLHVESRKRDMLLKMLGTDVSETRLSAEIRRLTIDERIAVKRAETLLVALRGRFRAVQSALRHLDAEIRL